MKLKISAALLTPLLLSPMTAPAQQVMCRDKVCPVERYEATWKSEPQCRDKTTCEPKFVAPRDVDLFCSYSSGAYTYNCTVWPQGKDLRFSWTRSGHLSAPPSGYIAQPNMQFVCTTPGISGYGGVISVTVREPGGQSRTEMLTVTCRTQQEY